MFSGVTRGREGISPITSPLTVQNLKYSHRHAGRLNGSIVKLVGLEPMNYTPSLSWAGPAHEK